MNYITIKDISKIRDMYKRGVRVELLKMNDPCSSLKAGDQGTVQSVDNTGTIHIKWDNGVCGGIMYGDERYVFIFLDVLDCLPEAETLRVKEAESKRENVIYGDYQTVLATVLREYQKSDTEVCGWFEVRTPDLTIAECVKLYAELRMQCDGDEVFCFIGCDCENLATGETEDTETVLENIAFRYLPDTKIIQR